MVVGTHAPATRGPLNQDRGIALVSLEVPCKMKEPIIDLETAAKTKHTQSIQLLTIGEVAEALQCSERAVWGWTNTGELAVVCLGRSRRYRPEDVQEFIAKHLGSGIAPKKA